MNCNEMFYRYRVQADIKRLEAEIALLKEERDACKQEIVAYHDRLLALLLRAESSDASLSQMREALENISKLGRVCPDFETCKHPSCADSCGAVLLALEALSKGDSE